MKELHFLWLAAAIVMPLLGAIGLLLQRRGATPQRDALLVAGVTLALLLGAWQDVSLRPEALAPATGAGVSGTSVRGAGSAVAERWLAIDGISAPLLPLAGLFYLLSIGAALGTPANRLLLAETLVSESILIATFSCRSPLAVGGLLVCGALWPLWELHRRGKPLRLYLLHTGLFTALLVAGGLAIWQGDATSGDSVVGAGLLATAVWIRSGLFPFHLWLADLFEHASFGTAILFAAPLTGVYAAVRLVIPSAPDLMLHLFAVVALGTAVYSAAMGLIQTDVRRFFCYLLLSHGAVVLVGLTMATAATLTGALCIWLSVGLGLAGLGLVLRLIEARTGRPSLAEHQGLYSPMPTFAAFFLLAGLASVGFPGSFGFIGSELLFDGAVHARPWIGVGVVIAAALNGIGLLRVYFRLFTAADRPAAISLGSRLSERLAILALSLLILAGGLFPQPGVLSRYRAATELIRERDARCPKDVAEAIASDHSLSSKET